MTTALTPRPSTPTALTAARAAADVALKHIRACDLDWKTCHEHRENERTVEAAYARSDAALERESGGRR
jgi:hypothetical protein